MTNKLSSLFVSHGSPMLVLESEPTTEFLKNISTNKAPSAIIVASAHWETAELKISSTENPETIYDFYGFPEELYKLTYPAKGSFKIAEKAKSLLTNSGFNAAIDGVRGLDHGAWSPLFLMYPKANIPVIEISVQSNKNAEWHYKIGQALKPLTDENILIMGSGNLTHNLREAFHNNYETPPAWVTEFSDWVAQKVGAGDLNALLNWQNAPYAKQNHPTPEHFLPFFVALGAAKNISEAKRLNITTSLGVLAMDSYSFA